MLTDEETQLVVGLGVALHLLIEQGKSKPCLEVGGHDAQELLVVETCKLIAAQLLVGIGTEIERCQMPGLLLQHDVVLILCKLPLLHLHVDGSLLQAKVYGVGMILHGIDGSLK